MAGNENTLNIQKSGPGLATVVIIYIQILTTASTAVGSSSEEREPSAVADNQIDNQIKPPDQ